MRMARRGPPLEGGQPGPPGTFGEVPLRQDAASLAGQAGGAEAEGSLGELSLPDAPSDALFERDGVEIQQ